MRTFELFQEEAKLYLERTVPGSTFQGVRKEGEHVFVSFTQANDDKSESVEWREGSEIWEGIYRSLRKL